MYTMLTVNVNSRFGSNFITKNKGDLLVTFGITKFSMAKFNCFKYSSYPLFERINNVLKRLHKLIYN